MKIISDYIRHYRTDPALILVTLTDIYRISSLIIIFEDNSLRPTYDKTKHFHIIGSRGPLESDYSSPILDVIEY